MQLKLTGTEMSQRCGYTSLLLSILEFVVIWSTVGFVALSRSRPPAWAVKVTDTAWVVGGAAALLVALVGLFIDRPRKVSGWALLVALLNFFFSGLPIAS